MHITREHRTKLENKSMKCIFLGYVDGEFGYHLRHPVKHKVTRSGDVIFNESEMLKRPIGDMEVKKYVDKFVDEPENIPLWFESYGE